MSLEVSVLQLGLHLQLRVSAGSLSALLFSVFSTWLRQTIVTFVIKNTNKI